MRHKVVRMGYQWDLNSLVKVCLSRLLTLRQLEVTIQKYFTKLFTQMWQKAVWIEHPMRLEHTRDGLLTLTPPEVTIQIIYKAFCLDVAKGCKNGAPNETRTHSRRFASVIFWPSTRPKNAIPRWYTGRKWRIPMASNRKRSRERIKAYDMGQGEGPIVPLQ